MERLSLSLVRTRQAPFVDGCRRRALAFAATLPAAGIQGVLLSGSVARGDYYPGDLGGMVDLTVFPVPGAYRDPSTVLGPDEEPSIPFHCVTHQGQGYQVRWMPPPGPGDLSAMDEALAFSLMESTVLVETDGFWTRRRAALATAALPLLAERKARDLGYARYLTNPYKVDRWRRRGETFQLHLNLSRALDLCLACLYRANGSFPPAEDRRMYYSVDLAALPPDWPGLATSLWASSPDSLADYGRRESLFTDVLLPWFDSLPVDGLPAPGSQDGVGPAEGP